MSSGRCKAPAAMYAGFGEAWMHCDCGERIALPVSVRDDGSKYVRGADLDAAWEGHASDE